MKEYLHLRCGSCELLMDAACVEAVDFINDTQRDSSGRRLWRDEALPVLDLTVALGMTGASRQQIVISAGECGRRCIMEVEEILDLRRVDASEWRHFAPVTPEAQRFFDGALSLPDGRCLLRLRQPLPWFQS
ncbi:MAG: chemotaxis protein CheW [Pedobacter sp.]|nr:chemotaxis protein CheW [Pedobacter sp.]